MAPAQSDARLEYLSEALSIVAGTDGHAGLLYLSRLLSAVDLDSEAEQFIELYMVLMRKLRGKKSSRKRVLKNKK